MPVTPTFDWEQSADQVIVRGEFKGFKPDAIDIFISDVFVKANAHPTYLLGLDLLHPIVVQSSTYRIVAPTVTMTLAKATPGLVWDTLCIDKKTPHAEVKVRRAEALERAEALYNTKLQTREQQKEIEKKRMFNEHWELEKQQRRDIEHKVKEEREVETNALAAWQSSLGEQQNAMKSPADIFSLHQQQAAAAAAPPPIRQVDTVVVGIDFTPKNMSLPSRTRGDEDFYRKSRYKPVSIEDSPMFWKEKGDKLYRARAWKQAADAYSESIKRDGCFLSCVSNRAACWLHMCEFKRAIDDCDLALTLVSNTPASETTQERYRFVLTKLHTRRAAAYAWNGEHAKALDDLRLATAYRNTEEDTDVAMDLQLLEAHMQDKGLVEARDPTSAAMQEASRMYYNGNYAGAVDAYRGILSANDFEVKARNNLVAALLQMGAFGEAYDEALKVIAFCGEVAQALHHPGVGSSTLADSDDEDDVDDGQDELVQKRNAAAKKISEKSGHVYLLLKAYVRGAAALCGLKQYRKAYEWMEMAVRITPYDDDLRDDANRLAEKLRFDTLISASTSANGSGGGGAAAAAA